MKPGGKADDLQMFSEPRHRGSPSLWPLHPSRPAKEAGVSLASVPQLQWDYEELLCSGRFVSLCLWTSPAVTGCSPHSGPESVGAAQPLPPAAGTSSANQGSAQSAKVKGHRTADSHQCVEHMTPKWHHCLSQISLGLVPLL